ncbi:MAG: hypothetical protein QXI19_02200 [Candidatus Caldarchaeum sp.]
MPSTRYEPPHRADIREIIDFLSNLDLDDGDVVYVRVRHYDRSSMYNTSTMYVSSFSEETHVFTVRDGKVVMG